MAADEIKTTVRLDPGLHARLDRAAQRDHRSMHAQIIYYVERSLDQDDRRDRRAATMRGQS